MATKIFIDQGHNPQGVNAGAEGLGLREQDITYDVGIYLRDILNEDPRFEARVSRPTPETVLGTSNATSLAARVNAANDWPADYFLSGPIVFIR
jgi:N-acetylmuramoyl-L-alanine amidase